tara:strand:+ start:277 stop:849 length:573 start_codon:yes stop_codon:yes gene_type:complete
MNIHQKILEKNLQSIFLQLLNGHLDLVQKILFFKKELEYDIIKKQKIENDFVNWLIHDINIRSSKIIVPYYQDYYKNNLTKLGLIENKYGFRRTRSLQKCFQSKWWMTTEKNNFEWKKMHKMIKLLPFITIWKLDNQLIDILEVEDNWIWGRPNIKDIPKIYNIIQDNILTIKLCEKNFYLVEDFIIYFS